MVFSILVDMVAGGGGGGGCRVRMGVGVGGRVDDVLRGWHF